MWPVLSVMLYQSVPLGEENNQSFHLMHAMIDAPGGATDRVQTCHLSASNIGLRHKHCFTA